MNSSVIEIRPVCELQRGSPRRNLLFWGPRKFSGKVGPIMEFTFVDGYRETWVLTVG